MCRPGYRWNPTLKRCLGMGGGVDADPGLDPIPEFDTPEPPPAPENMPAPAPSPQAQAKGKGGRGVKRVNPNGIVQKGTQMGGKAIPLK